MRYRGWIAKTYVTLFVASCPEYAYADPLLTQLLNAFQDLPTSDKVSAGVAAIGTTGDAGQVGYAALHADTNRRNIEILTAIGSSGPAPFIAATKAVTKEGEIIAAKNAILDELASTPYSQWGEIGPKMNMANTQAIQQMKEPIQMSPSEELSGASPLVDALITLGVYAKHASEWVDNFKPFMRSGGEITMTPAATSQPTDNHVEPAVRGGTGLTPAERDASWRCLPGRNYWEGGCFDSDSLPRFEFADQIGPRIEDFVAQAYRNQNPYPGYGSPMQGGGREIYTCPAPPC